MNSKPARGLSLIRYWDYHSPNIPNDVRDSSAASILTLGLLSLRELSPAPEAVCRWRSWAEAIQQSLWENYSSRGTFEPSILIHGTRSKPHNLIYLLADFG